MPSPASERTGALETARRTLAELPRIVLGEYPTPVQELCRLRAALGGGPRLLIKRDDAIPFACGGNKVRKLEMLLSRALAEGADTLISTGGLQSNHARVTAAAAARLGMRCVLVVNGAVQGGGTTGNARLMRLFGADVVYVADRAQRDPQMRELAAAARAQGRTPFVIPLGASTPLGALGLTLAVGELLAQVNPPDVILLASSSGGTQAGIAAGCALFETATEVIGVSADDPAGEIAATASRLAREAGGLLGLVNGAGRLSRPFVVDDTFVGDGYGRPTQASREAMRLAATTEGLVLDPVYTAKAMACLIAGVREGRWSSDQTVLFWHTGGVPGFFA